MPPSQTDSATSAPSSSPPTPTLPTTPTAAAASAAFHQQPLFDDSSSSSVSADADDTSAPVIIASETSEDENNNNNNKNDSESPSAHHTDESDQHQQHINNNRSSSSSKHEQLDSSCDDSTDSGTESSLNEQTLSLSLNNQQDSEQQKETVIVFDWDDTLLSSTFLASKGYRLDSNMTNVSAELVAALASLAASVIAVLRLAATYGRVHIITNAETGWVELSAAKFLPSVVPVLQELNIAVFSARSTFECDYPDSPLKWKCCAFSSLLLPLLSEKSVFKNILSFGDSHVEREAVRTVTFNIENTLCKSVKFAERPTCEQLRRQIDLVINCMNYIQSHDNHLDLQLTVTVNDTQQQEEEEKEEKMRCPEQSSMPAHDDGCGGHVPSATNPNNYMTMDEEDDEESAAATTTSDNNLLSNEEQLNLQLEDEKAVEAY